MKKSKSLFVLAGLAALALPLAACNTVDTTTEAPLSGAEQEIKAIYDKAVAEGLTDLTYEQWLDSIKGADGKDGAPGAAGADGATIVTGEGAPTAELGKIGDLYLDSATYDLYKKAEAGWAKIGNIKGDAGADGKDYERAKHTVIFNTDGGTVIEDQQIMHGEKIVKPADPEKIGYTFVDWEYEGERWSFPGYVCTSDMTIYANYTANKYNVTFDPGEGTLKPGEDKAEYTFDEKYNLPVPTLLAYTFDGWYNGEVKVNNGPWKIAKDVTLKAKYVAEEYTVTFDYNDGVTPNLVEKANADTHNFVSIAAKKPTRDGFKFLGWFDEEGNKVNGNYFADDEGKDRTYTAHWEVKPVEYDATAKTGTPMQIIFKEGGLVDIVMDYTGSSQDDEGYPVEVKVNSTDNDNLTYKVVGSEVRATFTAKIDGRTKTDTLALVINDAKRTATVAAELSADIGWVSAVTFLAKGDVLNAKVDTTVKTDVWKEKAGYYRIGKSNVVKLLNGVATLTKSYNPVDSREGTYTVADGVIKMKWTHTIDTEMGMFPFDARIIAKIADDLTTLTVTEALDGNDMAFMGLHANDVLYNDPWQGAAQTFANGDKTIKLENGKLTLGGEGFASVSYDKTTVDYKFVDGKITATFVCYDPLAEPMIAESKDHVATFVIGADYKTITCETELQEGYGMVSLVVAADTVFTAVQ